MAASLRGMLARGAVLFVALTCSFAQSTPESGVAKITSEVHRELSGVWDRRVPPLQKGSLTRDEVAFTWGASRIPALSEVKIDLGANPPTLTILDVGRFVVQSVSKVADGVFSFGVVNVLLSSNATSGRLVVRSRGGGTITVEDYLQPPGRHPTYFAGVTLYRHFGPSINPNPDQHGK